MQDSRQGNPGNRLLNAEDFQWGEMEEGIQIGLWCSQHSVEVGKHAELRAAVRNLSGRRTELGNEFGLAIQRTGEELFEYFGGPRPTTPTLLESGEFRELFGWRLGEPFTLRIGVYQCWVAYRPKEGKEMRSKIVTVEVGS